MATDKKRILLLIPNLGFGGAQRVFHDHSIELSKKYKVYECVFNREDGIAYPTGNELIDLEVPGGGGMLFKIYNFFLRCRKVRKIKKQYGIDISISHLEGADYINILSKGKEKTILCIHGSKVHDLNINGFLGWMRKEVLMPLLYKVPDKIITVSRDINKELTDFLGINPKKIQTINNFFDYQQIYAKANVPVSHYEDLFRNNQVIITSGRLALQKNQFPLLLIFSKLLQQRKCKLVILGDGELRQELIAYSRQLGIRTFACWEETGYSPDDFDVFFLGYQDNPFQYLRNASVFAFPSSWEGFPMALCEAMICGVPVVSTDCPTGPREILAPESDGQAKLKEAEYAEFGVLMPMLEQPWDMRVIDNWVKALAHLLSDELLRQSYIEKAQRRMLNFTPDNIMKQWEQVIESEI
jgi:glycosyltransferase involved in cell wall biosynthesis